MTAVIQWIMSFHKNRMTTRVITLWYVHAMSLTRIVSVMCFLIEMMLFLKAVESQFKGSYDKQNFTLVLKSYGIWETCRNFVS